MIRTSGIILLYICNVNANADITRYRPNWDDLDKRPLPQWYDQAKIGIMIHWGVYSVPSYGSEWFWKNWKDKSEKFEKFMKKNYPPVFTYQDFAPMFTAEFFDPDIWADLFEKAGAKYIVITSKHHEGFTLFPSKRSFSWNSVELGPKRDIMAELSTAIRNKNIKFGIYHSLYEWYNPIYLEDAKNKFKTRIYPDTKLWPDIKQLINDYTPSVLWSDGDWETDDTYWNSTGLLAWLYNDSPVKDEIVVNDRWGIGTYGHHGDFYNFEDAFNPGVLIKHKWESAFPLDRNSWGYRRNINISEVYNMTALLSHVVSTVSCGGNALINIGPTKEGTISPIFQERLLALGDWLNINGEAIYSSSPWVYQNDSSNRDVWYTCRYRDNIDKNVTGASIVYAIFLSWPSNNLLSLKDIATYLNGSEVTLLGYENKLTYDIKNGKLDIQLPDKNILQHAIKSQDAWTLKFTYSEN